MVRHGKESGNAKSKENNVAEKKREMPERMVRMASSIKCCNVQ